jgi:DNA-binding transcriptional MerR regulator
LRHSFIRNLLDAGYSLEEVQQLVENKAMKHLDLPLVVPLSAEKKEEMLTRLLSYRKERSPKIIYTVSD